MEIRKRKIKSVEENYHWSNAMEAGNGNLFCKVEIYNPMAF